MMTDEEAAAYEAELAQLARWRALGGSLPTDIAHRLGDEACGVLAGDPLARSSTGDEILQIHIPLLLRHVMARRAEESAWREEDVARAEKDCAERVAAAQARARDDCAEAWDAAEREEERRIRAEARADTLLEALTLLKRS